MVIRRAKKLCNLRAETERGNIGFFCQNEFMSKIFRCVKYT